ncbi:MAG: (E)-4-hydroxy-3-methylbut-2-enyl-diphosphate synthase [Treponema sp.]|jgi:(E)-4-hydroxy-3-methylbut-2-enyl-diphosphate synthase|nr:(E)-4-hydroxy-3-methylbut-2-enyl-diphosphate synthase [Treponema sp.]
MFSGVNKRYSKTIQIGGFDQVEAVNLGGGLPVVIQTMWKDRFGFGELEKESGEETVQRIARLRAMGCGLLRFAVPNLEAAEVLGNLASMVSMPLVADIHFDYRIALRCLDFPIAKIRINPGNIGSKEKTEKVLSKAASQGIPIRIGVNAGSLPLDLRRSVETGSLDRAEALVQAAERELAIFQEFDFQQVIISMKASTIADTIKANRMLANRTEAPLHIGVTEAGPLIAGVVRNTVAIHTLLAEGIGATIRVSLSDTMEHEVIAGREILGAVADSTRTPGDRKGVVIVSCPRCGRHGFDTHGFTERWQPVLYELDKDVTIAIMGCAVNGPEEARYADLGITGAGNKVLLFRQGKVIKTIDREDADAAFQEALENL